MFAITIYDGNGNHHDFEDLKFDTVQAAKISATKIIKSGKINYHGKCVAVGIETENGEIVCEGRSAWGYPQKGRMVWENRD